MSILVGLNTVAVIAFMDETYSPCVLLLVPLTSFELTLPQRRQKGIRSRTVPSTHCTTPGSLRSLDRSARRDRSNLYRSFLPLFEWQQANEERSDRPGCSSTPSAQSSSSVRSPPAPARILLTPLSPDYSYIYVRSPHFLALQLLTLDRRASSTCTSSRYPSSSRAMIPPPDSSPTTGPSGPPDSATSDSVRPPRPCPNRADGLTRPGIRFLSAALTAALLQDRIYKACSTYYADSGRPEYRLVITQVRPSFPSSRSLMDPRSWE